MSATFAAVEAGGTKFRAAIFDSNLKMVEHRRIATTTPAETLEAVETFFKSHEPTDALGIASFGPLIVDRANSRYGSLGPTPKPGWTSAPVLERLTESLSQPSDIQTDVEAAAVAEFHSGAGQHHNSVAYVTVGTGIGAAVAVDGVAFRGRDHTELGHIAVRRHENDSFEGICPFHGDCLEGMASGPAIAKRWGKDPSRLSENQEVWKLEAYYLAQLVRCFSYSFAPDIVLFGGGVGTSPILATHLAPAATNALAGYSVSHAENPNLVATAGLGADAGLFGAALLAQSVARGE